MVRLALILLLASAGQAGAQTTTKCGFELGVWTCKSQPSQGIWGAQPNAMDAFNRGREQSMRFQAEQNARALEQLQIQQAIEAEQQRQILADKANAQAINDQSTRAHIAGLVRDGDCEGAKKAALDRGDLDLAEQAMRLCAPR